MGKYLQRTTGTEIKVPSSSTREQDDNPVFKRLNIALTYMISKGNGLAGKQMTIRILTKIMGEAMEDMREAGIHPEVASLYIRQLSAMTGWVADGKWNSDIPMPEDFEKDCGTALRDRSLTQE